MYFTSGTTGNPKMVAHDFTYPLGHIVTGSFWHNLHKDSLHLTIADTGWGKAVWGKLYGQWIAGATVFVYDHEKFTPADMLQMIQDYRITSLCAPPTIFRFLIREDLTKYDLSSLQYCTIAGEALNPAVFDTFYKLTGIKLMEGFGQTETTLTVATFPWMEPKPGSMGVPNPQYDVDLLRPDGTRAEDGEQGQIVIHTTNGKPIGLFKEYYRDAERTREAWHDGLYYTGDVAWRDEDGYLWFVGRADDVIKSSGYRIGPFEVESALMTHPAVVELDITRMSALVDQVAELHRKGVEVVLISSGAVASGRSEIKAGKKLDSVSARQLYSAVGQAKLINRYYELFREHGMTCGQVLTTKENFGSRTHYLNQKHCMEVMLENKVIPIVNENDTISVTELMFTDNDELSGLIATMMGMEALIILSNIDGIYNGNPSDPSSTVIREIDGGKEDLSEYVQTSKSSFGRGGMLTKCNIAQKVADEGITVIIANGKKDNILVDLLAKDNHTVCTRFIPSDKPVSSVKKWIAHSEGFAKGEIHINQGAEEALLGPKATSILLVGVTRITGDFEKDDIVKIINEEGIQLGVGCVGYDSTEARKLIGCRDKKPLIHYNYLYLD